MPVIKEFVNNKSDLFNFLLYTGKVGYLIKHILNKLKRLHKIFSRGNLYTLDTNSLSPL